MLNRWALALLVIYAVALLVLSLISIGRVPSLNTSFDDKILHFGAYFIFTLLIYNYLEARNNKRTLLYAFFIAAGYGLLMEILQKLLTTVREFDIYDVIANGFGAVLAIFFVSLYKKLKLK